MAKKKKTKWNRAHFFKRKRSNKKGVGHPVYVYGTSGRTYKYLLFTHKPEEGKEAEYVKLRYNIDPGDSEPTYLKRRYGVNPLNAFDPPDKKYRIHEEDRKTVKKYQK